MKQFTLKAAAQHTGVSKSKIWRAVNDGTLIANKGRTSGGQEAWLVRIDDLERWAENLLNDSEEVVEDLLENFETVEEAEVLQEDQGSSGYFRDFHQGSSDSFRPVQGPPVELYMALVDKVAKSERRSVELELELRKYQMLLTENAESIVEREARLKELDAKREGAEILLKEREEERNKARAEALQATSEAERAKQEAETAKIELESLKTELATKEMTWAEQRKPWYKKLFSKSS